MQKNIKKIIITGGIILTVFIMPLSSFAITNVLTGGATSITDTGAKLSGSANPAGELTSGYFRYSTATIPPVFCNDIYGSNMRATNEVNLGNGNGAMTFKKDISGLLPNTTYYYCAIGSNKNEIKYGGVKFFTTKLSADSNETASITTKPASAVNSSSVYLNGFYNSSFPSETWFEYRKKTSSKDLMSNIPNAVIVQGAVKNGTGINVPTNTTGIASIATAAAVKNSWIKVGSKNHSNGTSGALSFHLTGLSSNTSYQFRAGIKILGNVSVGNETSSQKTTIGSTIYGKVLTFQTSASNYVSPGEVINGIGQNIGGGWTSGGGISGGALTLGQTATPPVDAIVRYHEGVETVFARQIIANVALAKIYGYVEGGDLQSFAWSLADYFGRIFGYVNKNGNEIRVSTPDTTAYELRLEGYKLTVYEYYNSKVIRIQNMTSVFKNAFFYEYFFRKR